MRISEVRSSFKNKVVETLRDVRDKIQDLEERVRASEDVVLRTAIRAPIAGKVVQLQITTIGGVITPGEPLMDIVPTEGKLVIEARINPNDIEIVHEGMAVQVRLTAYSQRNRLPEKGRVARVSADRIDDPRTGDQYYLAMIEIDGTQLILQPGMPAEVMVMGETRTAIGYLLEPIFRSFDRAFRES